MNELNMIVVDPHLRARGDESSLLFSLPYRMQSMALESEAHILTAILTPSTIDGVVYSPILHYSHILT